MKTVRIALLLGLAGCAQLEQASYERELVSFEPSVFQPKEKLVSSWNVISESQRDIIQWHLVGLGVSSTGVIQLIAVYGRDASGAVLHFQQIDLYGTRLFWSVLVDSDDMSARVIYHTHNERISDSFAPISDEPKQ